MEAGQLRDICRAQREKGNPLSYISDKTEGGFYCDIATRCDDYGNSYGVLTQALDTGGENDCDECSSYLDTSNISSLDDDAPIYLESSDGLRGFTNLSCDGKGYATVKSYNLRPCGIPNIEENMLLITNVLQAIIFCIIAAVPVALFGTDNAVVSSVQQALGVDFGIGQTWTTVTGAIACLVVLLCISGAQTLLTPKNKAADFKRKQRQSAMGEIFQMPLILQALFFTLTGIGEEVLFRLGIMSAIMAITLAIGADIISAAVIALLASSVIFAAAHAGQYKLRELIVVFACGCALGITWILSGSLTAAIMAHALYDFTASATQRIAMGKDARKYFFGKRPNAGVSHKADPDRSEDSYQIVF